MAGDSWSIVFQTIMAEEKISMFPAQAATSHKYQVRYGNHKSFDASFMMNFIWSWEETRKFSFRTEIHSLS